MVGQIFDYDGCFSEAAQSVDGINRGKPNLCDGLGYSYISLQFLAALRRAVLKP